MGLLVVEALVRDVIAAEDVLGASPKAPPLPVAVREVKEGVGVLKPMVDEVAEICEPRRSRL